MARCTRSYAVCRHCITDRCSRLDTTKATPKESTDDGLKVRPSPTLAKPGRWWRDVDPRRHYRHRVRMLYQAFGLSGCCRPGQLSWLRSLGSGVESENGSGFVSFVFVLLLFLLLLLLLLSSVGAGHWCFEPTWPNIESSCAKSSLGDTEDASPLCALFRATMTGASQGLGVAEAGPPTALGH